MAGAAYQAALDGVETDRAAEAVASVAAATGDGYRDAVTTELVRRAVAIAITDLGRTDMTGLTDLTVNGKRYSVEMEPRRLLADVLREEMGLTHTSIGCGHGVCASCTVLVDGAAQHSCLTLAVQCDGATIVRVEGLAEPDGALHPLQAAFAEHHALQCRFRTPGFTMLLHGALAEDLTSIRQRRSSPQRWRPTCAAAPAMSGSGPPRSRPPRCCARGTPATAVGPAAEQRCTPAARERQRGCSTATSPGFVRVLARRFRRERTVRIRGSRTRFGRARQAGPDLCRSVGGELRTGW